MSKKSVVSLTLSLIIGFLGGYYIADRKVPPPSLPTTSETQDQSSRYVCPMHPEISDDHASSCPICGMDLVETDTPAGPATTTTYVCPMPPEVTDDHVSSCPICDMDLVASTTPETHDHAESA